MEIDLERFIGSPIEEATEICKKNRIPFRVALIDGKSYMVARGFDPTRINFEVNNNIVTKITIG